MLPLFGDVADLFFPSIHFYMPNLQIRNMMGIARQFLDEGCITLRHYLCNRISVNGYMFSDFHYFYTPYVRGTAVKKPAIIIQQWEFARTYLNSMLPNQRPYEVSCEIILSQGGDRKNSRYSQLQQKPCKDIVLEKSMKLQIVNPADRTPQREYVKAFHVLRKLRFAFVVKFYIPGRKQEVVYSNA